MTPEAARNRENRRERKRQRLGAAHPVCAVCGYDRVSSLVEAHHLAAAANDAQLVVALCRNHHGELSDAAEDSLGVLRRRDAQRDPLTRLAAMMLGLADFLALLAERLEDWAQWLFALAAALLEILGEEWWDYVACQVPV